MTALIVIGSIFLLIFLLLLCPVRVQFSSRPDEIKATLRYLFLKIDFSPEALAERSSKTAKRETKKEYKKQKEEEGAKPKKEKAAADTAKTIWSLVKGSRRALNVLRRHLILYRIRGSVSIAREDAHQTAVFYGQVCALASILYSVLDAVFVVRKPRVSIRPDFTAEKSAWDISFRVRIRPLFMLIAAIILLCNLYKIIRHNKKKREIVKGGKRYEPTASHQ